MGIEAELKKEVRMTNLRRAILSTVQIAGVITLAVMAPKMVVLVDKLQRRSHDKLKSAVDRLIEKGLLVTDKDGIRLTGKGVKQLQKSSLAVARPRTWDRKWRIVIFDIPEHKKARRNLLRNMLTQIGFLRLQNSVWVYPFDCEELITLLKTDYRLGKEVLYMIVDKIERSASIQRHFGL